ncbi:MAG: hypothetical protein KJO07_21225 [Deltaproteobacteria bacterium]|jgi:hypothetical protein|nr:hypothetical protein [Deltaproteobacteria bacterium]
MEKLIEMLKEKTGLDGDTAKKVADFIQEHASDIPGWLGKAGIADKLPGGLGGMLGGD